MFLLIKMALLLIGEKIVLKSLLIEKAKLLVQRAFFWCYIIPYV